MLYTKGHVQGQVGTHSIEILNGCLNIDGDLKTIESAETEQLLDILLIWQYGLEEVLLDNEESDDQPGA